MDQHSAKQSVPELRKGILSDHKGDLESTGIHQCVSEDAKEGNAHGITNSANQGGITSMGLKVLALLAFQNTFKNILMRFVMKDQPSFLLSTAVITIESLKLLLSSMYIVLVEKQSLKTILSFMIDHKKNTALLCIPAAAYSLQMTLEYIAFANIDAASFAVLVQIKMLTTAFFFRIVLKRRLKKKQVLSLILLTIGVMLCNMKDPSTTENQEQQGNVVKGILAALGIACSSGFASVFTEKVIKSAKTAEDKQNKDSEKRYGLAHMQAQLATVSLVLLGVYAIVEDLDEISTLGFFHNFSGPAFISCLNSAVGGLIVASVLKYADSVLKGYATAVSVVLTGIASQILFATTLTTLYGMGMIVVVVSVLLYNGSGFDDFCF